MSNKRKQPAKWKTAIAGQKAHTARRKNARRLQGVFSNVTRLDIPSRRSRCRMSRFNMFIQIQSTMEAEIAREGEGINRRTSYRLTVQRSRLPNAGKPHTER